MSRITEHIDIGVPRRVAYDQWTQFESFPRFMEGVERVIQLDDKTLDWTANVAGKTKHWRAEIMEQRPDQLISWRSIEGARNDGTVRFEPIDNSTTRLTLELDVEPEGPIESVGDALGVVSRRAKGDLERFKEFIESRGAPEGGWRGEVHGGQSSEESGSSSTMGGSGYGTGGSSGTMGGGSGYGSGGASGMSGGSDYGTGGSSGTMGGGSGLGTTGSSMGGGSAADDLGATGSTGGDLGFGSTGGDLTGTSEDEWSGGTGSGRSMGGSETSGDR